MSDLDQQILNEVKDAIRASIREKLSGYSSPLTNIVNDAVKRNDDKIRAIIYSAVDSIVESDAFKEEMRNQFAHSVARKLTIQFSDSLADKAMQAIKSDQVLKAKAIAAVAKVIDSAQEREE